MRPPILYELGTMRILTTPLSTLEVIQLVLKVTERREVSSIVLSECQEGGKELGMGVGQEGS